MIWVTKSVLLIALRLAATPPAIDAKKEVPPPTFNELRLEEWLKMSSENNTKDGGEQMLRNLRKYTCVNSTGFKQSQIPKVLYILGNTTKQAAKSKLRISDTAVKYTLDIANQLLNENTWRSATTENQQLGPQLLQSIEHLFLGMNTNGAPINISHNNIDLQESEGSCGNVSQRQAAVPGVRVALPEHQSCNFRLFSVTYKTLRMNFPQQFEGTSRDYEIASDVMTNIMILDDEEYHQANLTMTFDIGSMCAKTLTCAFWNSTIEKWSSDGCTTHVANGSTNCACSHLTSYAVLMSSSFEHIDNVHEVIMTLITNVGLSISMASLILCIVLQVVLLLDGTTLSARFRSVALLNISLCLLLNNFCEMVTWNFDPKEKKELCVALIFCKHFSQTAFLCWTLVQSLLLFCRLVFVFYQVSKIEFWVFALFLGYACPIIISGATILNFYPAGGYVNKEICWMDYCSGAIFAVIIPAGFIFLANFLVLLVVIRTLFRPSISDGAKEDVEVVKKLVKAVLFCTPQFGLTWAIGIPILMFGKSLVIGYVFLILTTLQGCFIFLVCCLLDPKVMHIFKKLIFRNFVPSSSVMDLLKKHFSKNPTQNSSATTVTSG